MVFEALAQVVGAESVLFVGFEALEEYEIFGEHLDAGFSAGFGDEHRRFGDGDGVQSAAESCGWRWEGGGGVDAGWSRGGVRR